MAQPINPQLKAILVSEIFRPAITTWNRLEGRPRREDFDRSLKAEVRDPLWMICRQWQFGEFKGEDTASAVKAKALLTTARLNRYAGQSRQAVGYNDQLPLETKVERESVHFDLMTRAQMGQQWLQFLIDIGDFKALYMTRFGFIDPPPGSEEEAHLRSDKKTWQTFAALKGRVVDGERLLKAIRSSPDEHEIWLVTTGLSPTEQTDLMAAAVAFDAWFRRVYSQPDDQEDEVWADAYLEYQFACAAPADEAGERQTVLVAEQYYHGNLDWYAFDVDHNPNARLVDKPDAEIPPEGLITEEPITFIPNPIEFGGMPNVRWWEFEDNKTDFGSIHPSTSELATLLLAEFGLIYGNDWSLVPYELPVGALSEVKGIVVTDVFGVRTLIRPAAALPDSQQHHWGMYGLTAVQEDKVDTRLFLPPTVAHLQQSTPLEKVILARDEMANMVWGIEEIIPNLAGGGTNGYEAATDLKNYLMAQAALPAGATPIATGATIQYKLGTQVPENWIPFIPVHNPGSNRDIRLQRAAMPRLIAGLPEKPVEPRGTILRPGLDAVTKESYFINEEEVAVDVVIGRTYQRVRWQDGHIYTWLGRWKQIEKGPGSSGLVFDQITPTE